MGGGGHGEGGLFHLAKKEWYQFSRAFLVLSMCQPIHVLFTTISAVLRRHFNAVTLVTILP